MERCLGGSKSKPATEQHPVAQQQELQQLQKLQHLQQKYGVQQQVSNQPNRHRQQQTEQLRKAHSKSYVHQQQRKQHQEIQTHTGTLMATTPKGAAGNASFGNLGSLKFPPPPDYPPPPKALAESGPMPRPIKSGATKPNLQQQHQQQGQLAERIGLVHQMSPNIFQESGAPSVTKEVPSNVTTSGVATSSPSASASGTTIGISPKGRRFANPRYPDVDPDAIEVYSAQDSGKLKTLRTTNFKHVEDKSANWHAPQHIENMQMLQNPHHQHDYSYAYYEPGAAMRHSNIPPPEQVARPAELIHAAPPPNSIRALLSKGKKNKLLVSSATRQSYQTRFCVAVGSVGGSGESSRGINSSGGSNAAATLPMTTNNSLSENFYEEISGDTRNQLRPATTSQSAGSLNQSLVEEEFRRVQSRHRKILGELNLSVEAMLMPESPPNTSPTSHEPQVSVTASSGQPMIISSPLVRLSSTSADNICDVDFNLPELLSNTRPSDEMLSAITTATVSTTATHSNTNSNTLFCGDLDSGFSGSSGASYIGNLRLHKTNAALSSLMTARQQAQMTRACKASNPSPCTCPLSYSCRSSQRSAGSAAVTHQLSKDEAQSGFLIRASCGRRILNCAKIRSAEDPGPATPTESKARSFWNRKGWRKIPGFSSTSSINDAGIEDSSSCWTHSAATTSTSASESATIPTDFNITTTAQLHNKTLACPDDPLVSAEALYRGLTSVILPTTHHHSHPHHLQLLNHSQLVVKSSGSNEIGSSIADQSTVLINNTAPSFTSSTIAGGSFDGTSGSSPAAVGVISTTATATATAIARKHLENASSARTPNSEGSWCSERSERGLTGRSATNSSDEEVIGEDDDHSVTSASAVTQRNSQLRSTFNKAKQHLSFDKWRSSSSNAASPSNTSSTCNFTSSTSPRSANTRSNDGNNFLSGMSRRASCTVPEAQQTRGEELTTPGESPGGRLSRWFSIRRGSSHQYDLAGRDDRQSSGADLPEAPVSLRCMEPHASSLRSQRLTAASNAAFKMPEVPEHNDYESSALPIVRDVDPTFQADSRTNDIPRSAHARLITPMLPPLPPGLSQQQLKRRHIVAAIVHSENSYVATLQRLVNDYKLALEESSPPVLSANKISTLFHRLPDILQSHKLFRIVLAECVRHWDRDEKLGDCFVSAFSQPRILEIYSGFINNFSAAMELAKMEEKRKSALADFFKVKQISAQDRLSFFGLMVKPVQRFPQFILFLQDLLKYTPQGHHDRMSLQLALTQLELLAEMLNERKREAEQYQGFKEMLGHISGTFNTRSLTSNDSSRPRFLIREDNVTQMEFNQGGFIVKSKQRRLMLLNDKVICVSVAPKQSHDFGATEKLSFKWMYPVTDVEIVDNSTSATLSRVLTAGLNRGGSLKSNNNNNSAGNQNTSKLQFQTSFGAATLDRSPAVQLASGADNICNEMSTLMHDFEVVSRINDLAASLKGTYNELNANITKNLLAVIQSSIQRKDEEMAWVDSCCMQLTARSKSGKEEMFTFQTQKPNVKKEWVTELRLAQLALDANNSPAWETTFIEPSSGQGDNGQQQHQRQQQQLYQQKQSMKLPLFVKAMPVYKSQHQTEVRCGCFYSIVDDANLGSNSSRRHKRQNYLWICTSDGTSSHIAILSQRAQQAGNLRDVSSFDLEETQVTALEFVKGLENCKTREEHNSLLGDLLWVGTDSRKILIYSARSPEQEEQLGCCTVPGGVLRILYHFDSIFVTLSNASIVIYRRSCDGVWMLTDPQLVQLGEPGFAVPTILPINLNIYTSCGNRVFVLNALNGEMQKSFEVQHGTNQQVHLMTHSGIGLWISLKNSTVLCLYHTETFKHLQDINIAASVLRSDGNQEQRVNSTSIFVTALMACRGLLWVGTNVGIAVTIPLPRLEGVPIISGGINISCHAHFGPITFLLPLIPKVHSSYKLSAVQALSANLSESQTTTTTTAAITAGGGGPSMGEELQLPAIDDDDPKEAAEEDSDEISVILRRDIAQKDDYSSGGSTSPMSAVLRELAGGQDSSPRNLKVSKQHFLDQSFSTKLLASLTNSPALHRKVLRDLSGDPARTSKTLPRGSRSAGFFSTGMNSNTSTLTHGEHGYCDVYGLYGKLIFVKEDYESAEGPRCSLMDAMYEGMRRSDPELASIPGKVSTLDRRLRIKVSRPRSLDLSNWSVDSKSSSLYTSSGSEESMGIRLLGGRSVSRNSSSASRKTSANGSDLGNISENGLMLNAGASFRQPTTPKSEESVTLIAEKEVKVADGAAAFSSAPSPCPGATTLKRNKQKRNVKQQQVPDSPRTVVTLMGGRGYWRHVWYNNINSPNSRSTPAGSSSTPLIANSNDAHIVVWEKRF